MRRLVAGETGKRSELTEERLCQALQEAAVAQLAGAEEVWVALDTSDLRKPHAQEMEVRDLEGRLVPGYRVLNALAITPGARGLLYHRQEFVGHRIGPYRGSYRSGAESNA